MALFRWISVTSIFSRLRRIGVYRVKGRSMEPSLYEGDFLIVWGGDDTTTLRRGDVVVFSHPSVERRLMLKRVAAVRGERVGVFQDGVVVEADGYSTEECEMEWVLGEDEWFVMGDNPGASLDSRRLGPIRGSWIRGRVWFRYWPFLRGISA